MMKNVCFVVQNVYDFDPRVRRKAEALVSAGYSVDVLALRSEHAKKVYSVNGVNVYALPLHKKRGSRARYFLEYAFFFIWVFFRIPLQMLHRRYTVIDVNSLPDFLIFAPALARCFGAKLVLDLHEIAPEFYMSKYGVEEKSRTVRLLKFLERVSFNYADHVITINDPIQYLLERRGLPSSKSTVIMNAVDERRFSSSDRLVPRQTTRSTFVMMYHGTLTRVYGVDIAVNAFALVHEDMPGAELRILGSGEETDRLNELVHRCGLNAKVRLYGRVPGDKIPTWLCECDVGILPIRQDVFLDFAFPNKLSEYIIMGKAVIISRLKTIRHYFSEDAFAFFEPNNPVDLSRQMVRLYSDPHLRARLADKAKLEYAPIGWNVMKQRYLDMMGEVVASTSSHATTVAEQEFSAAER
jgi:glycosyltransferase involved in cell wall biosynthesis